MKVNFNRNLKSFNGKESNQSIADLLGSVMFAAGGDKSQIQSADEKYRAYKLANKIVSSIPDKEVELTAEDATFVKKIAAESFVAGAFGQISDLIEGINQ